MARQTDTDVVDRIALLLGMSPTWSSAADYLEEIAGLIGMVRPHPGDVSTPDIPDYAAAVVAGHEPSDRTRDEIRDAVMDLAFNGEIEFDVDEDGDELFPESLWPVLGPFVGHPGVPGREKR